MTGCAGGFPVRDLVAHFAGRWALRREITDDWGDRLGSFTGTATFTPDSGGLVYHEEGVLEFGSHRGPAHRTLHYEVTGPGQAVVRFDHDELFHDLDLREGRWRVAHPCRDDLYRGEFAVCDRDRWSQRWEVSGPAKAHTLTTRFERVPG